MTDARRPNTAGLKEWNAAAYHAVSEPQFAWGLRVLERVTFRGDERVLDAGCGSGRLTNVLGARVPRGRVVACDLSENMARAAVDTLGIGNTGAVVCADLSFLPFRAAFDLVFSTATFHWVRDHDRLFTALHGALRRDGRLEAQCGGGPNLEEIHARADALTRAPAFRPFFAEWKEPWRFASPEETEDRLRRAGFHSIRCWLEHAPTTFEDAAAFGAFIESVVMRPYLSCLPTTDLRRRFLDTLVDRAAADDPPFTLDYWRLNIAAATM